MSNVDQGAREQIGELRDTVKVLFGKVDDLRSAIAKDMGDIRSALAGMHAASGLSWDKMLSIVRDCAVLFSLVVGGIVWVSVVANSRTDVDVRERLARLEVIIGLATANAKRGGVSWVPEVGWR